MKADVQGFRMASATWRPSCPVTSGYVCYSSFAATASYLERNPDTAQRFVNGYGKAQRWVAESAAAAVAECIAGVFPEYPHDVLAESGRRYQAAGVWAAGRFAGRQGYDRTRDALIPAAWRRAIIPAKASCARRLRNSVGVDKFGRQC